MINQQTIADIAPQCRKFAKAESVKAAKLELMAGILNLRSHMRPITGDDFDRLFDLDIDELYAENTKAYDELSEFNSKKR